MADSWVAIDFETANSYRGSPCAVGMVAVEDGRIADSWSTLIQPPAAYSEFHRFNIAIHGITPAHVVDAPTWQEAYGSIVRFADGRPLVAHNAVFDISVLKHACAADNLAWPDLDYACTLIIARRTWRLLSYRLDKVADAASFELTNHHDALADAQAAAHIMIAAQDVHEVKSLPLLLEKLHIHFGYLSSSGETRGCVSNGSTAKKPIPGADPNADPDGPLYGRFVCITGTLGSMSRAEAQALLAGVGAQATASVSTRTDILVIGSQDQAFLRPGAAKSSKHKRAEEILAAGYDIELLDEAQFLERLRSH